MPIDYLIPCNLESILILLFIAALIIVLSSKIDDYFDKGE